MRPLLQPAWRALRYRGDRTALLAAARGKLGLKYKAGTNQEHLSATMEWLCRAQQHSPDDGVSGGYDITADRWYPSYPETTGYLIPTFYDYGTYSGQEEYRLRAGKMAGWLLSIQCESGGFPGPDWIEPRGNQVVFDTGQIIHGLLRTYEETGEPRYLAACRQAADWVVYVQEVDGSWQKHDMDRVHTYNSRTAWALLSLYQVDKNEAYLVTARKNLEWVIRQQSPDGWFQNAAFETGDDPLTHTIAYTIEGLLESSLLLADDNLFQAARLAADRLLDLFLKNGSLKGTYTRGWQSTAGWTCLTGDAQMALIWMTLFKETNNEEYFQAAVTANHFLKLVQSRSSKKDGVRGGVAGSYPIYGDYAQYLYINWAAKFFADSLLLEEGIRNNDVWSATISKDRSNLPANQAMAQ